MKSLLLTVLDAVEGWGLAYLLGPTIMGYLQSVLIFIAFVCLFYAVWFVYILFIKENDKPKNS